MKSSSKEFDACIAQTELILKRIQPRKNHNNSSSSSEAPTPLSPPEEASGALGKQLGESYLKCLTHILPPSPGDDDRDRSKKKKKWDTLGDDIIQLFCNPNVNIALVDHFFAFLSNVTRDDDDDEHVTSPPSSRSMNSSSWVVRMIQKWWLGALVTCEELILGGGAGGNGSNNNNNNLNVLSYIIRGFVKLVFLQDYRNIKTDSTKIANQNEYTQNSNDDTRVGFDNMVLPRLLQSLKLPSSRSHLIRECIRVSFHGCHSHNDDTDDNNQARASSIRTFIMPLLSITVISAPLIHPTSTSHHTTTTTNHHHLEEAKLFLHCLLQECHTLLLQMMMTMQMDRQQHQQTTIWELLSWLTSTLELFYSSSLVAQYDDGGTGTRRLQRERQMEHVRAVLEIGYDFIRQLLDLVNASLCQYRSSSLLSDTNRQMIVNNDNSKLVLGTVTKLLDLLLIKILPVHVAGVDGYCSPSHRPIWNSICDIVRVWRSIPNSTTTTTTTTNDNGDCISAQLLLSSAAIYCLGVMSLHTSHEDDVTVFLELISLLLLLPTMDNKGDKNDAIYYPYGSMVLGAAHSIGCMFFTAVPEKAGNLVKFTEKMLLATRSRRSDKVGDADRNTTVSVDDKHFFELFNNDNTIIDSPQQRNLLLQAIAVPTLLSSSTDMAVLPLSTSKQNDALLIGLSILSTIDGTGHNDGDNDEILIGALAYLDTLLTNYPHLGRRCLPVLIASCNSFLTSQQQQPNNNNNIKATTQSQFMKILEFICSSVARDAHCAHEVWSFLILPLLTTAPVGDDEDNTNIQCMILRLFPILCLANRRLYSRIRDTLPSYVTHKNIRLKIAAAATICDLAKDDLIRDVSEVIGWIQSFLIMSNTTTTDRNGELLVVRYAVMSLHYLVVGEELDYNKVIQVLNKKLVNLREVEMVLKLDDVVMEALVVLLGDGEEEEGGESSDSEEEEGVVSPQVKISVGTLIGLALSPTINMACSVAEDGMSFESQEHSIEQPPFSSSTGSSSKLAIFSSICESLAKYSLHSLGIDDSTIRDAKSNSNAETITAKRTEDEMRYDDLKRIISRGFENLPPKTDTLLFEEYKFNLTRLASKLTQCEGDVLGQTSLWKKCYRNNTAIASNNDTIQTAAAAVTPKKVIAALPSYKVVYERYDKEPTVATASATLLSLRDATNSNGAALTLENILVLVSELANVMESLPPDPVSSAITIRSWVSGMAEVWRIIDQTTGEQGTNVQIVNRTIETILGWRDELDQTDTAYVALAAFVLSIPDIMSHQIDDASNLVTNAYTSGEFDDVGMACTSLGILALKSIQCSSFISIDATIDIIEKELLNSSESGNLCFEAAFILGLVAQSLASFSSASKRQDLLEKIRRIVTILIIELNNCFYVKNPILLHIASNLKARKACTDLLQMCRRAESDDFLVDDGHKQAILSLYIALSLAMPAVLFIDKNILCGLNILLLKMPWGNGKGYMLASAFRVSKIAKLTAKEDTYHLLDDCSKIIQECHEGAEYDDVLIVLAEISNEDDVNTSITSRCTEILENDKVNFSLAVRISASTAVTKSFGTIPILFGGDGLGLGTCSQLRVSVSKKQISEMVNVLTTVADNEEEDTRVRDSAAMNIGILASMKYQITRVPLLSTQESILSDNVVDNGVSMLPSIPLASNGTITAMFADKINSILQKSRPIEAVALSSLLSSLKGTSLPTSFAKLFEALLQEEGVNNNIEQLKKLCVDLIIDQASALRRAASDRREFVRVSELLARLPPASFFSQLGPGVTIFMRSLGKLIPQWISDVAIDAIQSLWLTCCYEITHRHTSNCMVAFLETLKSLLDRKVDRNRAKAHKLSPATLLTIQKYLVSSFFPALSSTIMSPCQTNSIVTMEENFSVWTCFYSCLSQVPIEILDEHDFFSFQEGGQSLNIARVHAVSFLQKKGILSKRGNNDILKAQLWTAKQNFPIDRQGMSAYWLATLNLAQASLNMSLESRRNLINAMFETMLVKSTGSMCLDLLSTHVAIWTLSSKHGSIESTGYGCDLLPQNADFVCKFPPTLAAILQPFMLKNCPQNLAAQMRDLHMSSFVMNRALQVLLNNSMQKYVVDNPVQGNHVKCLKAIIMRSNDYGVESAQHVQHTSFIVSSLCL